MENRIKIWLEDIIISIDEISLFVSDTENFSDFQNDLKTIRAVERNIQIIGEAIKRVNRIDPLILLDLRDVNKIIGTRNRISHEYDSISDEIIWSIVKRNLPELNTTIQSILDRLK